MKKYGGWEGQRAPGAVNLDVTSKWCNIEIIQNIQLYNFIPFQKQL